jgi:hypothetical protein
MSGRCDDDALTVFVVARSEADAVRHASYDPHLWFLGEAAAAAWLEAQPTYWQIGMSVFEVACMRFDGRWMCSAFACSEIRRAS